MSADLLNAYLDGELTPEELARVERDLAASADLRRDLAELEATRSLLRSLPAVEPSRPITLPSTVPTPGRRPRRLGMAVAGVAAVWLVIMTIGVSLGSLPVVPDVEQLAVQHAAAEEGGDMPMGFSPMDADDMMKDDPAIMADIGHGMGLAAVYQADDLVQSWYSDGEHHVSVFHEPGEVDWDDMPDYGEVKMMDDGPMWRSTMGDLDVLVVERGDLVVTVVADGDMKDDMAMEASTMVPEVDDDPSIWDRLGDAPGNLFDRVF